MGRPECDARDQLFTSTQERIFEVYVRVGDGWYGEVQKSTSITLSCNSGAARHGVKELDLTPLLDLPIRRFVVSPDVKLSARGKKRDLRFTRAEIRWY